MNLKALAITSRGLEKTAALEISRLTKSKTEIKEMAVLFSPKKIQDLCLLCYKSQSVSRILFLLDYFEFKEHFFNKLTEKINKQTFDGWIDKETTFAVKCKRIGTHSFSSTEAESKAGSIIINNLKQNKNFKIKADLEKPDILFYIYIYNNDCYFGIDLSGFDLSKREYRIFTHPTSLKGTIAFSLLTFADYKKDEVLLDPFCISGEIPIEAALSSSNFAVNHYRKNKFAFLNLKPFKKIDFKVFFKKEDSKIKEPTKKILGLNNLLKYVNSSQKNAKIAGINKYITFSKIELGWLDIKLGKNQVNKIITQPPPYSHRTSKNEISNLYSELFYQAKHILKENGKIVLLLRKEIPPDIPFKQGFELYEKKEIYSGKQKYSVAIYQKQKKNLRHL